MSRTSLEPAAPVPHTIGFDPDEIRTGEPTRSARLKWVVVVDEALPAGRAANAAVCVAAATATAVSGLLGPDALDRAGTSHPGLPWAGCTVLATTAERLARIRAAADAAPDVHVADMPTAAQETRVYDDYLARVASDDGEALAYCAVSVVGPRKRVDKLVGGLPLLG